MDNTVDQVHTKLAKFQTWISNSLDKLKICTRSSLMLTSPESCTPNAFFATNIERRQQQGVLFKAQHQE